MSSREYHVAILGATGLVGRELLAILEERDFPIGKLTLLATPKSEGAKLQFMEDELSVRAVTAEAFKGVDLCLFSPGKEASHQWAPVAAAAGALVVDNSSAFRDESDVPLVVPEVNGAELAHARGARWKGGGLVANPNCTTIPIVCALAPLRAAAGLRRVVVSTYQAVSGAGRAGIDELEKQIGDLLSGREAETDAFQHRIAFNLIPQIDRLLESGYTNEERKIVDETRKILGQSTLAVTATAVRIPIFYGHSAALNIATERPLGADEARALLAKAPGVKLLDAPKEGIYPMPMLAVGGDHTLVGRIREDRSQTNGLDLFLCADNVRKGAALNAVQIAEELVRRGQL